MSTDPPPPPPGEASASADGPPEQASGPVVRQQSVGRAGAIMASGSFVSRVVGLVRAALLTGVIGTTGYAADAFTIANNLPNQFYLLIAGGTLNAILVPQIVRAKLRPDGDDFVNRIITLSLALLAAATVLLMLAAPLLVRVYARFDNAEALGLATIFAVICLPQVFFYGLYTILGQVLNANGRFAGYMWAPALANIVAVLGLLWFMRAGYPTSAAPEDWTPADDRDPGRVGDPVDRRPGRLPRRPPAADRLPLPAGVGAARSRARRGQQRREVDLRLDRRQPAGLRRHLERPHRGDPARDPARRERRGSHGIHAGPAHRHAAARPHHGLPRHRALHPAVRGGEPGRPPRGDALPRPGAAAAVGAHRPGHRAHGGPGALRRVDVLLQEHPRGDPRHRHRARRAWRGWSSPCRGPT